MVVTDFWNTSESLLFGVVIVLLCCWVWNRHRVWAFIWSYPLKINTKDILSIVRNRVNALAIIEGLFDKADAHTLFCWWGWYPVLMTRDPVVVEKVLSSPDMLNKAYPMYEALNNTLGRGILTSPESEWQYHRKWINISFKHKVLVSLFPILNRAKNKLIDDCGKLTDGQGHNIFRMVQSNVFGAGYESLMGNEVDATEQDVANYLRNFSYLIRMSTLEILLAYFKLNRLLMFYGKYARALNSALSFMEKLHRRAAERKNIWPDKFKTDDRSRNPDTEVDAEKSDELPIFLNRIFQLFKEKKFSWSAVSGEANTVLTATIETTTNALYSSLILLAMHPAVQERLHEEICSVFVGESTDMEYEYLDKLPYLDMVIREVLRLVPSIPMIGRQFTKPMQISEDLCIPKGFQVVISIYLIHRRKDIWGPSANKFDPDRFSNYNNAERHPYAYIPFSKGTRNCLGWRYATFALKTMLSGLIRNYRFDTDFKYENLEFVNTLAITFKQQPKLKINRRT